MPDGFIFQQDGAPAHTSYVTQYWLRANCNGFIAKHEWPPNSPDHPLDNHAWGCHAESLPQAGQVSHQQLRSLTRLQKIWNDLPQKPVTSPHTLKNLKTHEPHLGSGMWPESQKCVNCVPTHRRYLPDIMIHWVVDIVNACVLLMISKF